MAQTFKMINGDLVKGNWNELRTISGLELLRQHVYQAIKEVTQIDDIGSAEVGDHVLDIVSSILSFRIYTGMKNLKDLLTTRSVSRVNTEKIGSIDLITVKRDVNDPRIFRFWVRVISQAKVLAETTGIIGG